MTKAFKQVDVFTSKKYYGNPVAVFLDADELTEEEMQKMANWTNLSETTFVLKPTTPEASYKVRIFTTVNELDFAGHPTLGTCFALLEAGAISPNPNGKIIQECRAGLVELSLNGDLNDIQNLQLTLKLPYFRFTELTNPEHQLLEIANALGGISKESIITIPTLVDVGPKWLVVQLNSEESVLNVTPDYKYLENICKKYDWIGTTVFGKTTGTTDQFETRNFAPLAGVSEDPACGSGAGSLGAYLGIRLNQPLNTLYLSQGRKLGRDGKLTVHIEKSDNKASIYISGQAVTCISGSY